MKRKLSIQQAAAELQQQGIQLIRALPWDGQAKATTYLLRDADGRELELTTPEIMNLINN